MVPRNRKKVSCLTPGDVADNTKLEQQARHPPTTLNDAFRTDQKNEEEKTMKIAEVQTKSGKRRQK